MALWPVNPAAAPRGPPGRPTEWGWYRSGDQKRWLSSRGVWWIFALIRFYQVLLAAGAIATCYWVMWLVLHARPAIWFYSLICAGITSVFLLYLVPATLSTRIPGGGVGGFVPVLLDTVAGILWLASWIGIDRAQENTNCVQSNPMCSPITVFLVLGIQSFGMYLLCAFRSYNRWMAPRNERIRRQFAEQNAQHEEILRMRREAAGRGEWPLPQYGTRDEADIAAPAPAYSPEVAVAAAAPAHHPEGEVAAAAPAYRPEEEEEGSEKGMPGAIV